MTTTPDSRIRADWTLPAETAAPPPTVTPYDTADRHLGPMTHIDTSTTAGKIAVMQAYERGERIESTPRNPRDHAYGLWTPVTGMAWNWGLQDYRIAPPTAPRSALKIAQDYNRNVPPTGGEADTNLRGLLQSFTAMPVLYIHGSGSQANIDWTRTDSRNLTPGRYRLVRDDV